MILITEIEIRWSVNIDVVEFETTIDKRKKKPVAINIVPANSEIVGENRVEGTIAVVARQQENNGVNYFILFFILFLNICCLV